MAKIYVKTNSFTSISYNSIHVIYNVRIRSEDQKKYSEFFTLFIFCKNLVNILFLKHFFKDSIYVLQAEQIDFHLYAVWIFIFLMLQFSSYLKQIHIFF